MTTGQLEYLISLWRERANQMLMPKGIVETYNRCAGELEQLIKETK